MNSNSAIVIIAAIAMASLATSSIFAATASASVEGKENAQQPGKGVCNADDKIHHNAPSEADEGFHNEGVEKNFGGPFEGFVGDDTPCQNELP
jgi:hypothetical protein